MFYKTQNGFTLVELAIVLMIIGLLIGGVLKGQELIENARILTVIRQVKSYEAATTTFQDIYSALPGDMVSPGTRLPNCGTPPNGGSCDWPGNGDGQVASVPSIEGSNFWRHLAKANLVTGVETETLLPQPKMPVGSNPALAVSGNLTFYFLNQSDWNAGILSGTQAARIDRKLDDGMPLTGSARGAIYTTSPVLCHNGTIYVENQFDDRSCFLTMRVR